VRSQKVLPLLGAALLVAVGACDNAGAGANPEPPPREVPERAWFSLPPNSRYFEADGIRRPLLMRNVSAPSVSAFLPLFRDAKAAGTELVRLQLTQGFGYGTLGIDPRGRVLPDWASQWDDVLDAAEQQGLAVIPVFAIWGDWNDGNPDWGWTHFDANPLNVTHGGPATSPQELFLDGETTKAWHAWLAALIERWHTRPNIVAWELFSELDLATGVTEPSATAFVEKSAELVRSLDVLGRPVFASTSDLPLLNGAPWTELSESPGNDILSLHPYDPDLDRAAVSRVHTLFASSEKPVLIGESGLDAAAPDGTTLTSSAHAATGLTRAIWAELVSGAASARSLYWEDGYAAYFPESGLGLVNERRELEREAAAWLEGKNFTGLLPVELAGATHFGAAMASANRVYGWARNAQSYAPDYATLPLDEFKIEVGLPPDTPDATWSITLTNPYDGSSFELEGVSEAGVLAFDVARSMDDLAFEATRETP